MNWFQQSSRLGDAWFPVGLASSFPDIGIEGVDGDLSQPRLCNAVKEPGCKVFYVPAANSGERTEVPLTGEDAAEGADLRDQVLVFRYRGKFHAIDHRCPHSSYPLSKGTPFDIEDFGIVLSAGITCPKHGWSFDLHSGMGDRGSYRLKIWEVQVRDVKGTSTGPEGTLGLEAQQEVWVRRKQRMG